MNFHTCLITRSWTTACALLVVAAPLGAQELSNYQAVNSSIAHGVFDVGTGDLDGDGLQDVVTASETDGRLVWYRNLGAGDFAAAVELARGETNLAHVGIADLDGDGDMDVLPVATVEANLDGFLWLENTGGGQFVRSHWQLTPSVEGTHTSARDWNGDGDVDLLICGLGTVMAYLNNGKGGFDAGQSVVTAPNNTHAPQWGDLNGDGREDLLFDTANSGSGVMTGQILYLPQLASGAFGPPVVVVANAVDHFNTLPIDLNGDGLLDIVRGSTTMDFYANLGAGVFSSAPVSLGNFPRLRTLVREDADGDGDQDLFFSKTAFLNDVGLGEWINNQDGTLAPGRTLDPAYWSPTLHTMADLDNNGVLDLVWTSEQDFEERVHWSARDAAGIISPGKELTELISDDVLAGDFNGDGLFDVAEADGELRVYYQDLDGTYGRAVSTPLLEHTQFQVADLNADGFTDVIVAEYDSNGANVAVLHGSPAGLGAPQSIASAGPQVTFGKPHPADVDSDGDLDLVCTRYPMDVGYFENLGSGNWGAFTPIESLQNPWIQEVRDLDGDGLPDILLIGDRPVLDGTHVIQNAGGGAFAPSIRLDPNFSQLYLAFSIDLDGDGLRDILRLEFTGGPSGYLSIYRQTPGFQFSAATTFQALPGDNPHYDFAAVDWNRDGLEDLMMLDRANQRLSWGRNLGNSVIGGPQSLTNQLYLPTSLDLADFDGDMDLDALVGSERLHGARLFYNARVVGTPECNSKPNSTGVMATLTISGSIFVSENRLRLTASNMPLNQLGYFLIGASATQVVHPGSHGGVLCLGDALGRYNIASQLRSSGNNGLFGLNLDLTASPGPFNRFMILSGETWYFQAWFQDDNPNPTSNFTNSVKVEFR